MVAVVFLEVVPYSYDNYEYKAELSYLVNYLLQYFISSSPSCSNNVVNGYLLERFRVTLQVKLRRRPKKPTNFIFYFFRFRASVSLGRCLNFYSRPSHKLNRFGSLYKKSFGWTVNVKILLSVDYKYTRHLGIQILNG